MTREELVNLLKSLPISLNHAEEKFAEFLTNESDISIRELNVDSLVVMEICIALEERYGVSITTHQFERQITLNNLLEQLNS